MRRCICHFEKKNKKWGGKTLHGQRFFSNTFSELGVLFSSKLLRYLRNWASTRKIRKYEIENWNVS